MLERLLFLLILINTSVDYAACVWLFRNIIFLLHVSKQRRNPAVSLKTVSLFSLVRFWFPVICRILVLLPKAANRGAYYTNSRTLYVCVREANNMRIRKEKSARKRVCVCMHRCLCVCETETNCVCVCVWGAVRPGCRYHPSPCHRPKGCWESGRQLPGYDNRGCILIFRQRMPEKSCASPPSPPSTESH